jgi:ketol-acid reductoisomerase
VALRPGSPREAVARADGAAVVPLRAGAATADVAALLVPDEAMPALTRELRAAWKPGAVFVLAHSYNLAYDRLTLPDGARVACVAPAGPGALVRRLFTEGGGVNAFLALSAPGDSGLRSLGLAYAAGIGCARAGVYECTPRQETEVDLFGEQAVLCGGLCALLQEAFRALVEAGYPPEMAYLECVHQVNLTAQLVHEAGVEGMRDRISPTALFGDLTRGPRIASAVRPVFERMLAEIRDGRFAAERDAAAAGGAAELEQLRRAARDEPMERVRAQLFPGPR